MPDLHVHPDAVTSVLCKITLLLFMLSLLLACTLELLASDRLLIVGFCSVVYETGL